MENPAKSELLSSTLRVHGNGANARPIFRGANDQQYRILFDLGEQPSSHPHPCAQERGRSAFAVWGACPLRRRSLRGRSQWSDAVAAADTNPDRSGRGPFRPFRLFRNCTACVHSRAARGDRVQERPSGRGSRRRVPDSLCRRWRSAQARARPADWSTRTSRTRRRDRSGGPAAQPRACPAGWSTRRSRTRRRDGSGEYAAVRS